MYKRGVKGHFLSLAKLHEIGPPSPIPSALSKKWSSDPNHLLLVLGCLQNLVHSCPENVVSVFDNGGHRVLVAMLLGNDCVRPDVREKVRVILRALAGPNL